MLLLVLPGGGLCEGVKKKVRFAKGKNSATITGGIIRGDRDKYLLGAREGQKMTVRISSAEDNAVFQVYLPGEQEALEGAGETDDAKHWEGKLPVTAEYVIVVGATRGNASYKLEVKIE